MRREQHIFLLGILMFFLGVIKVLLIDWTTGVIVIGIAMLIFLMGILVTWMQLKSVEMVKEAVEKEKERQKSKKKKKHRK